MVKSCSGVANCSDILFLLQSEIDVILSECSLLFHSSSVFSSLVM